MAIIKTNSILCFLKHFLLLRYFRINDPYRLLGLLVIFTVISLPLFIDSPSLTYPELKGMVIGEKVHEGHSLYTELVDSTAPLAGWFDGILDLLFGRSLVARRILAFLIIFIQASYLGIIFANQKAFAEGSYIPSLIYAVAIGFSFDTLSLTPELLGAGALLPALSSLFKEIEFREQKNEVIFNLGLYISIASLFAFSYSVFLIGAVLSISFFTRSSPRKYILLLTGFLLPHLLLNSIYFLKDGVNELWSYFYLPNLRFQAVHYISNSSLWWLLIVPLFVLVIAIFMMNREARLSKYQTQLVQATFVWTVFSFVQILYSKDYRPQNFITLAPGFSFFVTHFLLIIQKKRLAEIVLRVFILATVAMCYLTRYGVLDGVRYDLLLVPQKKSSFSGERMLVLDDSWEVYTDNQLASPFLNWNLTKSIFTQPEYYDNVIRVYKGFKEDPPDMIRDRNDLMKPFLARMPELKENYRRDGIYYVKTNPRATKK